MHPLFILETGDPVLSCFLLLLHKLLKLANLIIQLLLGQFKLPLSRRLLDLKLLQLPLNFNHPAVQVLYLLLPLYDRFFLQPDNVLQRSVAFDLVGQLGFEVMAGFVHPVEFVDCFVVGCLEVSVLFVQFLVVDLECAVL